VGDWKKYKLGEVADIQTGPFGSQLHASDYIDDGIPSIMPTNIGNFLKINSEGIVCIRPSDATRLHRYIVSEGDVVYSRRGDVEKCAFISAKEDGWLCGTGCLRIRFDKEKTNSRYCAYYMSTEEIKGWVSGNAVGTTMPNLNSSILENLPFILPPLPEQRAITGVLSSLDDKIDLLHRQNKTLEAMAEALFRQWFIEEDGSAATIGDIIDFAPPRNLAKGSSAPYLEMANVNSDSSLVADWYVREFSSGTKFMNGDTLLARITPCLENGKACYVSFLGQDQVGWGSTEFIVMHPKTRFHPLLAYALVKNREFRDFAESCLEGSSGRQRVNVDHLSSFSITLPEDNRINEFNAAMRGVEPKLSTNSVQIRTLATLRDALLPKLMSGEVQVKIGTRDA
jgi:type I restriction enzyme S subunit